MSDHWPSVGSDRYAAVCENLVPVVTGPHGGQGAHGAPARERRGVLGPREQLSRGPGWRPGLD
jgi:hypothetical protein